MIKSDEGNLRLVGSVESVDELNARFYGRFPYPWVPLTYSYPRDPQLMTALLHQDVGDWKFQAAPGKPKIWVAGCGTNQAILAALRFPNANVLGSDLSGESLRICSHTAERLQISNLELRQESINQATYRDQFDYVICTGVIHHNADPAATLRKLANALRPEGLMELMVYNRFHWIVPTAFQQSVRILGQSLRPANFELELSLARKIIKDLPQDTMMFQATRGHVEYPESQFADALLQPVLYGYTVESLESLAEKCNLELLLPRFNQFDAADGKTSWNMKFNDPILKERYESLPDTQRWQITNLLLLDSSPLLWFYLQRKDSGRQRKSERQVCEEFLDTTFVRINTTQVSYKLGENSNYELSPHLGSFPVIPPHRSVSKIAAAADGKTPMREIFKRLGLETAFAAVNHARLALATTAAPYLTSVNLSRN